MKKVRELKSWIEGYEQVTSAVGDLQVLFDFAKEGEATEEEVDQSGAGRHRDAQHVAPGRRSLRGHHENQFRCRRYGKYGLG